MALDEETRARLSGVSTATLTTCLFKRGFRNVFLQDVHPVAPGGPRMVGEAFTLRLVPAREDLDTMAVYADPDHPQRKAIETCPAGHVLVIDSRGDPRAASAGDILIARLKARGVAGIVTDGGFRDVAGIARLGFPAYHRRPSAPPGVVFHHAADFGLPIGCGGVAVYPGDVMVGDEDGVVCIPAHLAAEVAAEAVETTLYEEFVEERVRAGDPLPGLYPASEASRAAFALWRNSRGR
jgi:regulator of RNase E activity RraA